jgi:ubiquinone/menaquinone biosynthesis C-methylase UbiE
MPNCPICNSTEYKKVGLPKTEPKAKKIIKEDYSVVQCQNCNFYFVDPPIKLSPEEWNYLYDSNYFFEMTGWHKKERIRQLNYRLSTLEKYCDHTVKNYLDVGCGEGLAMIEAKRREWIPHGIDISDNRRDEAKTPDFKFTKMDLISANFPANFFDVILMDSVLEHVTNPMESLQELYRILSPGGALYLGIPNENSLINDVRSIGYKILGKGNISARLRPFESPYHISGFNRKSLNYAIKKSGFKIALLRNFATKMEFLKSRFLSKSFLVDFALFPFALAAVPLRKEVYYEAFLRK